jgi:ureidoacrylate peracid hydrolase
METAIMGPEIGRSALIIVDMQNDFVHADGRLAQKAREIPDAAIDMSFLMGTIPYVEATRRRLPSGWTARDLDRARTEANYSDAQIPYWRLGLYPGGNRTFITEGTWGAQVVDELKPLEGEHLIVKKGFGGFGNTPLDTILRNSDYLCRIGGDHLRMRLDYRAGRCRSQLSHDPGQRCGCRSESRDP